MFLGCLLYQSVRILSTDNWEEMILFHESVYFLVIHGFSLFCFSFSFSFSASVVSFFSKLHSNDSISVFPMIFLYQFFDMGHICFFSLFFGRTTRNTLFPGIISRKWHPGNATQYWKWIYKRKYWDDIPFLWIRKFFPCILIIALLLFLFRFLLILVFPLRIYLFLCARSNLKKSFSCSR